MKRICYFLTRSLMVLGFGLIAHRSNAGVPAIVNFSPTSAASGSTVSILGANFSSNAASNTVYFGAVTATVVFASPTNLIVTVPTGAIYAPVTVTVNGLTAWANAPFLPTFLGNGSGINATNFGPGGDLATGSGPNQTLIADLDGDGKPDVIVVDDYANSISIFRNISTNGTLTPASFAPRVDLPTTSGTYSPSDVAVADVDGDGKLDIIVTEYGDNVVSVYRNNCTPGVINSNSFATRVEFPTGTACRGLVVRDLDGDGKPDIVTGNTGDGTISILRNTCVIGTLTTNSFAPKVDFTMGTGCGWVAVGDLNGDGKPDIIAANGGDDTISILQNNITSPGNFTSNSFAPMFELPVPSGPQAVSVVDVDGDNQLDLVVTAYLPQTVSVIRNLGIGGNLTTNSFAPRIDFSLDGRGHTIAIGDLDGDGKPDLAVDAELNSVVSLFDNLSTPGSFTNSSLSGPVELETGWNAWGISVGDLDGDGRPDVIFCNSYDSTLQIYQNLTPFGAPTVPPTISVQPTNVTVTVNGTAVFNVVATGAVPLNYQWNFNGTNLPGATNATLVLTNVMTSQAGNYSVMVSESSISVTSSVAVLTVYVPQTPPVILYQTPSQVVAVSNTATFTVQASGTLPLSYQWSQNGVPVPGATNASYLAVNAQLSDSGSVFSCLVTNLYGSASSSNMVLKVIDTVPNGLCEGAIVVATTSYTNTQSTLKADAPGNPVPDCVYGFGHGVWYEFTSPVAGLLYVDTFGSDFDTGLGIYTGACGAMTEVACNDDAGGGVTSQIILPTTAGTTYYILAGGYDSDAGDLVFHLNYVTPPIMSVQPANLAVVVSSNATFSPVVTGTLPITFQWYFNNLPLVDGGRITGSATSTLNIANVQLSDGGDYVLVASNFVGVTTSTVAVLTPVILPPTFAQLPVNTSAGLGSNVMFSAVVTGTPPYGYQWYFNGNALTDDGLHIAGSATASLIISNVTMADAGNYQLIVTNSSGAASATATLTILIPPLFTLQPVGRSVPPGLPTAFTVSASGTPAPGFQWQLNGTNIPGAIGATYTNAGIGTNDLGFYQVIASNTVGMATSLVAQLTFGPVAAWGYNVDNESLPPPGLSNVFGVAGGNLASFALRTDGNIVAWGGGTETNIPSSASNVVAISSYYATGDCALRSDGTVVGWSGFTTPALSNIVSIAVGQNFAYALRAEGTLTNWGQIPSPGFPAGLNHVTAIAAGNANAVALRDNGTVVVSGNGPVTNVPSGLNNVVAIAAGGNYFAMALESNGTVVAWGSAPGTNLPPGLTNVVAIACNNFIAGNYGIAIRSNGTVVAWGSNTYGETNPPPALQNLNSIAVAAGSFHSLALLNDGRPVILQQPVGLTTYNGRNLTLKAGVAGAGPLNYQWLLNGTIVSGATNISLVISNIQLANAGNYQLFVNNSINTALSLPAPVNVISNNTLTSLGQTIVSATNVYQGGKVTFWSGPVLGNGPLNYQWYFSPTNQPYSAVPGATNDTLSLDPALAVQSGRYYLAVSNQFAGTTSAPVTVRIMFEKAWGFDVVDAPFVLSNVTELAVGNYGQNSQLGQFYALSAAGKISSWGVGFQEFNETNFSALSNSTVTAIAAGYGDALALKSDGTVFAVGDNVYGETNVPASANGIVAIACGDYHDLALKYDGTVIGWGQNTYGQATNNTNATNVVSIAAGGPDSIALRADGTVTTWGEYGFGQYPQGEFPIPPGVTNVVAVAAGSEHFLALRANGTVVAWGESPYGQTVIPANWTNIVAISAGGNHSTALRNDGTVLGVGAVSGIAISNDIPSDLTNVIAIASGGDRDVALFGTRAPAFTVQPWSRSIFTTTTSVWFSAKCAGVQPVTYQWMYNGTNVPGATNDTISINATVANNFGLRTTLPLQSGVYQLVASNSYGVVASHYAQLTVLIPLGVALNATNQSWITTGNAQWIGETNVSHDGVSAAQSGDIGPFQDTVLQTTVATNVAGSYTFWWKVSSEPDFDFLEFRINGIVQTNISGNVDWQSVAIPVPAGTNVLTWHYYKNSIYSSGFDAGWVDQFAFAPNPTILIQPRSITNYAGTTAFFFVEALIGSSGQETKGVTYQWLKNGVPLSNVLGHVTGATNSQLALVDVQDADAAVYTVVVGNSGASVTSSPATLTVLDSPPVITAQPLNQTNSAGTTATFTVGVVGAVPLNYQWQKNGTNLPVSVTGAGSLTLTLTNVQDADAASYTVIVTNIDGCVTSSPAILAVIDTAPVISAEPASVTTLAGSSVAFSVMATGSMPMNYQWQMNGTNLPWGTNSSLAINHVSLANAGSYQVIVTNFYSSATSSVAILRVVHSIVVAWGENTSGQTNVPPMNGDVIAIAGGALHSLAVQGNGTVMAWGYDGYGETNVPPGLSNVVAVAGGEYHSLALQANGTVVGWGYDSDGEIDVPAGLSATAIAAGNYHSLALQSNGSVVAWGYDGYGQTDVPSGLTNVTAVSCGGLHSLALLANGTVAAWGNNGDGETNVPAGLTNVVAIAGGCYHNLALLQNGTVVAWGYNGYGETNVPSGLTNVIAIAAGCFHSMALLANGSVVAWGMDQYGQIDIPANLTNSVVAIAAGGYHSLAIQNDGSPFITHQPVSQMATSNATVQFTVTALGVPTLGYQWQKNGVNLADVGNVSGSATATLTLSNVQTADMAGYSVIVSNNVSTTASQSATLTVAGVPVITVQPMSQTVNYGVNVQLGVVALGNPPPVYQWWQNGTNPVGGNSPNLILTNVARAQDGVYFVTVSNAVGGLVSSNVVLTVLVPQLLGSPVLLPNGALQISSADIGGGALPLSDLPNFDVQASSNLVNWATISNALSLTNGMLLLQDNARTNKPIRFYRIVEH